MEVAVPLFLASPAAAVASVAVLAGATATSLALVSVGMKPERLGRKVVKSIRKVKSHAAYRVKDAARRLKRVARHVAGTQAEQELLPLPLSRRQKQTLRRSRLRKYLKRVFCIADKDEPEDDSNNIYGSAFELDNSCWIDPAQVDAFSLTDEVWRLPHIV
eukprot:TRINITY_DN57677_c0_g1_i1.p1 TRINITY_DN57677_c0_g1~~TRINITY_DN57677_c0_g1_i1.p1  ORF type:complete len:160 (+),score=18.57 TRINITY_DN57677_c0_g1_i1:136-615(+)